MSFDNLFNSPNRPAFQADFDAMRVAWRSAQDILHNSPGEPPGALILFQDDEDPKTGFDIVSVIAIHDGWIWLRALLRMVKRDFYGLTTHLIETNVKQIKEISLVGLQTHRQLL